MKDLKKEFKKRAATLKKESRKNKMAEKKGKGNDEENNNVYTKEKICPFMSTPEADRACTSRCKFYRPEKKNYECYFMVLQTISWFMKVISEEDDEKQ